MQNDSCRFASGWEAALLYFPNVVMHSKRSAQPSNQKQLKKAEPRA